MDFLSMSVLSMLVPLGIIFGGWLYLRTSLMAVLLLNAFMSDLLLSCSLNHDRPKIQHSDVTDESIFTWICMFATIDTVLKCYCHSQDTPLQNQRHRWNVNFTECSCQLAASWLSIHQHKINRQTSRVNVIISNGKLMPSFVTVSM